MFHFSLSVSRHTMKHRKLWPLEMTISPWIWMPFWLVNEVIRKPPAPSKLNGMIKNFNAIAPKVLIVLILGPSARNFLVQGCIGFVFFKLPKMTSEPLDLYSGSFKYDFKKLFLCNILQSSLVGWNTWDVFFGIALQTHDDSSQPIL